MTERETYIHTYSLAVINAAEGTGLFPSLFMAQAVLESGNGQSSLAKKYNNHFGVKASSQWKGKVIELNTREVIGGKEVIVKAKFRWYDTSLDSFKDRVAFLRNNQRYTTFGVFSASTPEAQADALQKAGYATDPNYANTLKWLIRNYDLKALDQKKKIEP